MSVEKVNVLLEIWKSRKKKTENEKEIGRQRKSRKFSLKTKKKQINGYKNDCLHYS